jgi:hypothetical protein
VYAHTYTCECVHVQMAYNRSTQQQQAGAVTLTRCLRHGARRHHRNRPRKLGGVQSGQCIDGGVNERLNLVTLDAAHAQRDEGTLTPAANPVFAIQDALASGVGDETVRRAAKGAHVLDTEAGLLFPFAPTNTAVKVHQNTTGRDQPQTTDQTSDPTRVAGLSTHAHGHIVQTVSAQRSHHLPAERGRVERIRPSQCRNNEGRHAGVSLGPARHHQTN